MSKVTFLSHSGKEILYADLSGCKKEEEVTSIIEEVKKVIQSKKSLLLLVNVTNMSFSPGIINIFQSFATQYQTYFKAMAVVGLGGLEKMIFKTAVKSLKISVEVFSSTEQVKAQNWLVGIS